MDAQPSIPSVDKPSSDRVRLRLVAAVIPVLWIAYTVIEGFSQAELLHPVLSTILEYIPGLFGIGLLLTAGLTLEDCFLKRAAISKQGMAVFFLMTPLYVPALLSATYAGWNPVAALVLSPLSAISQELFFRCALLPALLIFLPKRLNLAIVLQTIFFGLWHVGPIVQHAPIYGVIMVMLVPALFGLGWGWQTRHDRTVFWAMVYHIILLFIGSFYTWGG